MNKKHLSEVANIPFKESDITIFPNPAQNSLEVKIDSKHGGSKFVLSDLTGKNIFQTQLNPTLQIQKVDLQHLQIGFYLASIINYKGRV